MGIHLDACRDLLDQGMEWAYIIMDDHAPLGPFHEKHLNQTLPNWGEDLSALYIGLNGHGQGRPQSQGSMDQTRLDLEQVNEEFHLKFSLHPGLWHVPSLAYLLEQWTRDIPLEKRTAWKFERMGYEHTLPEVLPATRGSYRINGKRMHTQDSLSPRARRRLRKARIRAGLQFRLHQVFPGTFEDSTARNRHLFQFYDGPYPLFWSGLLKRGGLNNACMDFLNLIDEKPLLTELEHLKAKVQ